MSRLAAQLGFTTMSVYRYVASKDDLLVLCLDATIGAAPDLDPDSPWREQLEAWAGGLRDRYQRHAWMLDVPISGLPAGPNQLVWFERGLRALAATALEPAERASTVLLLSTYVRGQVQMVADLVRAATPVDGRPPVDWAAVVTRVADASRFPEVAALVAGGVFEDDLDAFPDDEYEFGLRRILDGVEALHGARVAG
jgi:AcrR family transcriptional regulator